MYQFKAQINARRQSILDTGSERRHYIYLIVSSVFKTCYKLAFGAKRLQMHFLTFEHGIRIGINCSYTQNHIRRKTALLIARHVVKEVELDRKSTRLNSSHVRISYAVFCL